MGREAEVEVVAPSRARVGEQLEVACDVQEQVTVLCCDVQEEVSSLY